MATTPPTILGSVSDGRQTAHNTPLTFSHTVEAGTDVLLVAVGSVDFFLNDPSVTWNGTDVPCLWADNTTTEVHPSWFLLPYPETGTANIVVSWVGTPHIGSSLTAAALNIGDYGGIRFGEGDLDNIPPYGAPSGAIYNSDTDLVIDLVVSRLISSVVFTPDMGQTILVAQDSEADAAAKLAMSQGVAGASTTMGWTLAPTAEFAHFILAIKGLDGVPAGAPDAIGPVTYTQTLGQQPPDTTGAREAWRWRHEVTTTHRFLAVLIGMFDGGSTPVTGVTFTLEGGSARALTSYGYTGVGTANGQLWILESAPVGVGYIQASFGSSRRWFLATAYSLLMRDASDVIAFVGRTSSATSLLVDSRDGAITTDLICAHTVASQVYTATAPSTQLYDQEDYYHISYQGQSQNGAGSYVESTGNSTTMGWSRSPSSTTVQIAFSFLPSEMAPVTTVELIPRRQRRTPHLSHEQLWTFYHQFQVDVEAGLGLTTGQGSEPQIMLRWSDDGGHTWSNEHWVGVGPKGQYKFRSIWRRLGRSRDRIFEVTVSDPIPWNLIAAYLDVDGGTS